METEDAGMTTKKGGRPRTTPIRGSSFKVPTPYAENYRVDVC